MFLNTFSFIQLILRNWIIASHFFTHQTQAKSASAKYQTTKDNGCGAAACQYTFEVLSLKLNDISIDFNGARVKEEKI
jgi:hypothetical protein